MRTPFITHIQKYSIHDGEGIRTTVFFKGCPLSCKWCHNPEAQKFEKELLFYQERCVGCGICQKQCPVGAVQLLKTESQGADSLRMDFHREKCICCGRCEQECIGTAREVCGTAWEIPDLMRELLKDQAFYETSGGGVTLSGGEVLAQDLDYLEMLLYELHRHGVRVNIDTCGEVPFEAFLRVLPFTDTFLYDIKLMDENLHRAYTGQGNGRILENLKKLSEREASIWIRIPVTGGVNDTREEMERIGRFLKENRIRYERIHLLPYHRTGSGKYPHLGRTYEGDTFTVPDKDKLEALRLSLEREDAGPVVFGG